jgi:hypothetical protein
VVCLWSTILDKGNKNEPVIHTCSLETLKLRTDLIFGRPWPSSALMPADVELHGLVNDQCTV